MLKRLLRLHAKALIATTLFSALGGLITTRLLSYTNKLAATGIQDIHSALMHAGGLLIALLLTSTLSNGLLARLGAELVEHLRTDLADKFLAIDYEKVANRSHSIYSAIISDLGRIGPLVLYAPQLAYNSLLVVLFSGYLVTISPPLYLVLALLLLVMLMTSLMVGRFTRSQFDEMRSAEEVFFKHLKAIGDGKKDLSLSRPRANHFANELLRPAASKARSLMTRVHLAWAINESWSSVSLNGAIFTVVFVGYTRLGLSSAAMIQFVLGALFIVGPASFIIKTIQGISLGLASLRHLEQIGLDLESTDRAAGPLPLKHRKHDWKLLNVADLTYRYEITPGDRSAFGVGPVTFSIRRGEIVFVVGGNGSGKSTLLLLLCGLLSPQKGLIHIDGQPTQKDIDGFRELFCGTFGDCFIFQHVLDATGSLKSDDDVELLLRQFDLGGKVEVDRGELSRLDLSTGQRKRLALIQSFAQDRDIYFFDEWAAEQDPTFREYFYCSVLPTLKRRGKTVIAISHDDRYFHVADHILKLECGEVISDTLRKKSDRDDSFCSIQAECPAI